MRNYGVSLPTSGAISLVLATLLFACGKEDSNDFVNGGAMSVANANNVAYCVQQVKPENAAACRL